MAEIIVKKKIARKMHPNSLKNLRPIQKGVCLNPGGRKKGMVDRTTLFRKWTELPAKVTFQNQTFDGCVEDEVAIATINKAREGDIPAVKTVLDNLYGVQQLRFGGDVD